MSESSPSEGRKATAADGVADGTTLGRRDLFRTGVGAAAATGAAGAGGTVAAQAYGGWFEDVSNYEGTLDYTGRDAVTVEVGAGENGLLFEPPAVLVDPGTTVTFEWTGAGGQHNVVHQPDSEDADPAFESELMGEEGATFEYTFEEESTFRYYCSPHQAVGMKGAVAVGETEDELIDPDAGGGGGSSGPLTTADLLVLAGAVALGLVLVVAVVSAANSPGEGEQSTR
jgi:halocyanin-like protein